MAVAYADVIIHRRHAGGWFYSIAANGHGGKPDKRNYPTADRAEKAARQECGLRGLFLRSVHHDM